MSTAPSVPTSPFEQVTTPNIERANRLMALKAHPGFLDLLRLSQDIVQSAADICADYGGWDAQQIVVLKVRMQAAKEHHAELLARINAVIDLGVAEARDADKSQKSVTEVLDQSDHVRQKVLETFEQYDSRPAGSF